MTPRRITYTISDDGPAPDVGDCLHTTKSSYLIVEARVVRTRDGARRFALMVIRFPLQDGGIDGGRRNFSMRWNNRGRRRKPQR